jgi:hypothetical protein
MILTVKLPAMKRASKSSVTAKSTTGPLTEMPVIAAASSSTGNAEVSAQGDDSQKAGGAPSSTQADAGNAPASSSSPPRELDSTTASAHASTAAGPATAMPPAPPAPADPATAAAADSSTETAKEIATMVPSPELHGPRLEREVETSRVQADNDQQVAAPAPAATTSQTTQAPQVQGDDKEVDRSATDKGKCKCRSS